MIDWKIEKRKLSELKELPNNPRRISNDHFERLKKKLSERGFHDVIKIDTNGCVLSGNQRLRAMKELWGDIEVDVKVPDRELTEEERKKIVLESNQNEGEFDIDILANEFEDILEEVGLDDLLPEVIDEVEEDDYQEPAKLSSKVKLGEVWQLGNHRLMCGDSTKIEDVEKLMNGEKADMVFTDPPYGVNYASKNEFLNRQDKGNCIQVDIENDTMTVGETADFIYKCFVNLRLSLADKSSYYITAPQGGDLLMVMMMMMQKADIPLRHMLVWVKNNHVLGRTDYNYKHEPILYGWINTHNFYGKGEWKFSTWEIDKPLKNDLHPTMKPIALMINAIRNSTLKDNMVLDLFGGSGSTLIACEQTNRRCYMMELDEHYCDVIIDRWEKLANKEAVKISS
jgi:DNA modification methylase